MRESCDLGHLTQYLDIIQNSLKKTLLNPEQLHFILLTGMHTITIRSISDSTVSSTTPDSYDPHDLMGKVGNSIEQLDIILYQVISCKSKLDEIFRHLSQTSEDSRSVSVGVVSVDKFKDRVMANYLK